MHPKLVQEKKPSTVQYGNLFFTFHPFHFQSWIKKRLKNFTVIPAPMQVIKSEDARINGTCLEFKHPKRGKDVLSASCSRRRATELLRFHPFHHLTRVIKGAARGINLSRISRYSIHIINIHIIFICGTYIHIIYRILKYTYIYIYL